MSDLSFPSLQIPPELMSEIPPSAASAINDRFRQLEELYSAALGLRGTVNIAQQKQKDQRGVQKPGLNLEMNRIASVADPVDASDVVTLAYHRRQMECSNITRILENCDDHADLLSDEDIGGEGTLDIGPAPAYVIGMTIWPTGNVPLVGTANVTTNNDIIATLFKLPFRIVIAAAVFEVAVASASSNTDVGWYDINGDLKWHTGAVSCASTGAKRTTLSASVSLEPGMYYQAYTSWGGATTPDMRGISSSSANFLNIFNSGTIRHGTNIGGGSSGLPSTLTLPLTAPTNVGEHQIFALMEAE